MKVWYTRKFDKFCDYLENRLERSEQDRIESELSSERDRLHVKRTRELVQDMHQLKKVQVSESFDTVLRARMRKEAMQSAGWLSGLPNWQTWRVPAFASAALCMLAIGFYAGNRTAVSPGDYAGMAAKSPIQPVQSASSLSQQSPTQPVNVYVIEHILDSEMVSGDAWALQGNQKTDTRAVVSDSFYPPVLRPLESDLQLRQASTGVQF